MWFSLTHGFLDANISKMYEGTINGIQFWKFLFGLHRKSDEGPDEKKNKNNKTYL